MTKEKSIMNNLPGGTILHGKTYEYEIRKTLGQGSFGITYLAAVKMRGELGIINTMVYVAVKEFFMHEINGRDNTNVTCSSREGIYDKYKKKFIGEAKNLGKLKHENIIQVVEAFEENNTVYYSMEFLDGGSLDDYISQKSCLSEKEALMYTSQIASALSFMHSKNMLHLDLKPSNVMLRDQHHVVLIDFGLSKQFDENGNPESSTTIGGGTPGYAPLEQANYHGDVKSGLPVTMDIYALGATLFKMLVGHKPPVASDILNEGFPQEELKAKGIDESIIKLIIHAMSSLRKDRISTIVSFQRALQFLLVKQEERTIIEEEFEPEVVIPFQRISAPVFEKKSKPIEQIIIPKKKHCPDEIETVYVDSISSKSRKIWLILGFVTVIFVIVFLRFSRSESHGLIADNDTIAANVGLDVQHSEIRTQNILRLGSKNDSIPNSTDLPIQEIDYRDIKIGDYFYSDGSYSSEKIVSKSPIGVVYSLSPSDRDKERGWAHGYIMALSDAKKGNCKWGPYIDFSEIKDYDECTDEVLKDKNGYEYCNNKSILSTSNNAFSYARNYGRILPETTSNWFLPTVGNWVEIIENLGKVKVQNTVINTNTGYRRLGFDANKAMTNLKIYGIDNGDYSSYWTSNEAPKYEGYLQNAWMVTFCHQYDDGSYSNFYSLIKETTRMRVRAIAAF